VAYLLILNLPFNGMNMAD